MLYRRSKEKELTRELFENPGKEYRGAPFWAWNEKLDKKKLTGQIRQFKEMGMGGFHIHCRVGLDTPYLGEEFFDCVKACEEEAKKEDLLCYLYDEDRWPSGSAGGLVTENKEYRTRFLVFSPKDYQEEKENSYMAAAKAVRSSDRTSLGMYEVELDKDGYLVAYKKTECCTGEHLWEAWLEISGDTPWFNNQAYVNTLDEKAIKRFIQVTHQRYYQKFGEDFGKEIPAIFTDEPQTAHMGMMGAPFDREQVIIPFTDDFEESFYREYGYSLLERLPEIFWEKRDQSNYQIRYHYHRHVAERFARAFGDQVGQWCQDHGIGLTGHMLNEWTLYSQTLGVGEAMRPMREFAFPGVDMLCDRREFSTLKQAQSVARQQGREGVMCEIYGVTGWDFDFRGHKLAGDWQAALGVTLRVPHLTWVSMEGEAKRDYPACIGRHSPWYKKYMVIEDHFARLNTALTRGKAIAHIGVIHPVESYWMEWGNKEQTAVSRQIMEENFGNLIQWLLFGLQDFDFISEAMLAEDSNSNQEEPCTFFMGHMEYSVLVVPECHTLRSTTLDRLEAFREKGGEVIFMGTPAGYIDGKRSERAEQLAKKCRYISYNRGELLESLEAYREVDVEIRFLDGEDPTRMKHTEGGKRAGNLCYQLRQDGDSRWLFLSHVQKAVNEDIAYTERWKVWIKGEYVPVCYDTMTGEIYELRAFYDKGGTIFEQDSSIHGSLLVKLERGRQKEGAGRSVFYEDLGEGKILPEPVNYELEEENVFLLDQGEYAFDEEEWQQSEELLRIDNLFRKKLGYPLRMEALAQPWTQTEKEQISHCLKLRFDIFSQVEREKIFLAMEHPEKAHIFWNGESVSSEAEGWYVDESIQKVALKGLKKGRNILELHLEFGKKTNVEWMYLLGTFGVRTAGRMAQITELPQKLVFGNLVNQELAFYGGNLIYESEITTDEGKLILEVSHYRGALMEVSVDGQQKGNLFMAPYRISCGEIKAGKHRVRIRIFGNRINTFGAVHNGDSSEKWYGPNLWRTSGNKWSYEYQLKEMGILTSPVYWIKKE